MLALVAAAPVACHRAEETKTDPVKSASSSAARAASVTTSAPAGPTVTAAPPFASASAFVLAPNKLCPGPCEAQWDDDGDGKIDRAASYSYLPDGRVDHVRTDLDADGIVDKDKPYAYRMPTTGDVLPRGLDGAAWQGVLFLLGGRIWIPYDRAVIFELPGVSVTDCESATTTAPEPQKTADHPVPPRSQAKTAKSTCEGRMLTAYETLDASGARLGSARYSYACWPKERGCPATPAFTPIAPRTSRSVCRADADKVAAVIDPDPRVKPPAKAPAGMPGMPGMPHAPGAKPAPGAPGAPGAASGSEGRVTLEPTGARLVDVPQHGAVDHVGLRPADRVVAVAGVVLDKRPDGEVRKAVAAATDFDVALERAGLPVTLHVHVGGDCSK